MHHTFLAKGSASFGYSDLHPNPFSNIEQRSGQERPLVGSQVGREVATFQKLSDGQPSGTGVIL